MSRSRGLSWVIGTAWLSSGVDYMRMRLLSKRSLKVAFLVLFVFRPGLGSLITWFDFDQEGTRHGFVYSGFRFNLRSAFNADYWQHFPPAKLICLIDTPASLFSGTVALPVTAVLEYRRSRRTDERLYGTWKSDRDRTMEEYHQIYDRYSPSGETVQKVTSGFGKRSMTFSATDLLVELEGESHSYRYRVVLADTNRVLIRWRPSPSGPYNEFLAIEFDQHGFWCTPQSAACREYFRKQTRPKITGANAGGPRQLPMRTRRAARVAQFCR